MSRRRIEVAARLMVSLLFAASMTACGPTEDPRSGGARVALFSLLPLVYAHAERCGGFPERLTEIRAPLKCAPPDEKSAAASKAQETGVWAQLGSKDVKSPGYAFDYRREGPGFSVILTPTVSSLPKMRFRSSDERIEVIDAWGSISYIKPMTRYGRGPNAAAGEKRRD